MSTVIENSFEHPEWDVEQVRQTLVPLDVTGTAKMTPQEISYCRYYNIYFEDELPVKQCMGYTEAQGFKVAVHYFAHKEAKANVLVMHGYYDHVGLYKHLIGYLLREGYSVFAYDLPGHGLSTGEPAAIKSFADYQSVLSACLRYIKQLGNMPLFAVAQSTGAAVLIDYYLGLRHDKEKGVFDAVVMLAPLIRPKGWHAKKWQHMILRPFFKTWKRVHRDNTSDSGFLKFLREYDPLQAKALSVDWVSALKRWIGRIERAKPVEMPLTIIQGEEDGTVDWRHNVFVLNRKFKKPTVHYIKGAEHHLVNESEEIRERMFPIIVRAFSRELNESK